MKTNERSTFFVLYNQYQVLITSCIYLYLPACKVYIPACKSQIADANLHRFNVFRMLDNILDARLIYRIRELRLHWTRNDFMLVTLRFVKGTGR